MRLRNVSLLIALTLPSLLLTIAPPTQAAQPHHAGTTAPATVASTRQEAPRSTPPDTYTVRSGDTLTHIAREHDQPYRDLLGRNKRFWSNPDLIHPGDTVHLTGTVRTPEASRSATQPTRSQPATKAAPAPAPAASGSPKAYARSVLNSTQFSCLDRLFTRESGWRTNATNPSSGAYGIPQALPGSKMASAGADWQTNGVTQVKWGISYVNSRYGSACGAWNHFTNNNWY